MIAAWLFVRALLERIPGIAWVILLVLALVAIGGVSLYRRGEQHGAIRAHQDALVDSVRTVVAQLDTARRESDVVVKEARVATTTAAAGRAHALAVLEAHLADTPPEVVNVVEAQFALDAAAEARQADATTAVLAERPIVDVLDTLQLHTALSAAPPPSGNGRLVTVGLTVTATLVGLLTLLHFAK